MRTQPRIGYFRNVSLSPTYIGFRTTNRTDGRTVELSIEPSSIIVPHKELPKSPKKLRSKARRQEAAKTQITNQDRLSSIINKREKYRKTLPKQGKAIALNNPEDPEPKPNQLEI